MKHTHKYTLLGNYIRPFDVAFGILFKILTFGRRLEKKKTTSNTLLIYSPNIGGHRMMYIEQFVRWADKHYQQIVIAYAGVSLEAKLLKIENYKITDFSDNKKISYHEIPLVEASRKTLVDLNKQYMPELTLLIDGDRQRRVLKWLEFGFDSLSYGKVAGLFIHTDFASNHLRGPRHRIRQSLFYSSYLKRSRLLDYGLFSDDVFFAYLKENCTAQEMEKFIHFNEISMPEKKNGVIPIGFSKMKEIILEFIADVEPYNILLIWGDLENRKGYDWILRLACEEKEFKVIRLGRTKPQFELVWGDVVKKETLYNDWRLLEFDSFMPDEMMSFIFKKIAFLPMPYHDFFRTSGVMHQALLGGLPVVVPALGVMGFRTESYNLGSVFKAGDYEDFRAATMEMRNQLKNVPESFADALQNYKEKKGDDLFARICARLFQGN